MRYLFNTLIFEPLYNALVFLMGAFPWLDVGVIIIIFTIGVRLLLFPLSQKAVRAQAALRDIEPDVRRIRERHAKNPQEAAVKTMELYRERKINPFSGFLLILIQLPIIFALYFIFTRSFPEIDTALLYPFIKTPSNVNTVFLGVFDVTAKSLVLALGTGITQFIQAMFISPKLPERKEGGSFKDDLARSFQLQVKYVLPVVIFFVAWSISAAISIYWTTSNLFMIAQEYFVKRKTNNQPTSGNLQQTTNNQQVTNDY